MRRTVLILGLLFLSSPFIVAASEWQGVERIVAVGDVHGDFEQFVTVLRSAGVLDSRNRWRGGKTHFVQIGDLNDRGPDSRKIMDLIMDLEKQARRAGGAVHALIGNHEAMNIYGDLRYVTPEEFASFSDADSERIRDYFYEQHLKKLEADPARKEKPDDAYREAWNKEHPLGYFEHRFQYGPNGKYGKWIQTHNTIIRINDTIFVHGGISPKYVDFDRDAINNRIRDELKDLQLLKGGLAVDPEGPLWYRGLAKGEEPALLEHVKQLLQYHGARRIVVGHTPTAGAVLPRFGGRVLLIDVGLAAYYGSRMSCLLMEGDSIYAIHRGERLQIPSDPGSPLLEYLKQAAELDPPPSPLQQIISKLEASLAVPQ